MPSEQIPRSRCGPAGTGPPSPPPAGPSELWPPPMNLSSASACCGCQAPEPSSTETVTPPKASAGVALAILPPARAARQPGPEQLATENEDAGDSN